MASIRKYRDKWRAEVRRQGHKPMSKVFVTRKAAESWAKQKEIAIEQGDLMHLSNKRVQDAIDRFLEENETTVNQRTMLNWWAKELGHFKLSQIRRAHVITARKILVNTPAKTRKNEEPRLLAPATINRRVAMLSKVFRLAIEEWDWMRDNPCHIRALTENNERDRLMTPGEQEALWNALRAHAEPSLYPFVLVAIYTGMRASEVQGLMWKHIDLDTGHIQLLKTKNKEKRAVVVGGDALELLKARKLEYGLKFMGYVFGNTHRGTVPYNYRAHWADAKRTAGVEDLRFHDLRHAFTTEALKSGMNPVMVQLVTGHKSSQMLKRYSHLTKDVAAQVSNSVVEALENSGKPCNEK